MCDLFFTVWCVLTEFLLDLPDSPSSIPISFLLPSPEFFSPPHMQTHTHALTHTGTHSELVHMPLLLSALPEVCIACAWGRVAKRDTETERKKGRDSVCLVLCCYRLCHVNSNFNFLCLKSASVPPILSSLYISCIPLLL